MAKRVGRSTKPGKKKGGASKRKSRDFSPEELKELAWIRSMGLDRPLADDEDDAVEDEPSEIVDPVLGKLRWDVNWRGHVAASAFGKRVPLIVEVFDDHAKPTVAQRDAFAGIPAG